LLDYGYVLRNAAMASAFVDGDEGFGFTKQFLVKVQNPLGSPVAIFRDALLELRVLRRLSVTDLVVFVVVSHTLLAPFVVPTVERFAVSDMQCLQLRLPLPATDDGVHVEPIEL
jgi:hypothetical protein